MKNSKSFFDRLTGGLGNDEEKEIEELLSPKKKEAIKAVKKEEENNWPEENADAQLTVDMYQKPTEVIIKTIVAGVKPGDLDVSISEDMITIKGHREKTKETNEENYYYKELYWGGFSRTIMLPQEVDADNAEASIKEGLLVIRLPKLNKERKQTIKIKTE